MEVLERASGARMHTALYRPFAIEGSAITAALLRDITQFLTRCSRSLAGAFLGLLNNRSFKSRLALVGQVSLQRSVAYGLSGILARSAGLLCDLRVQSPAPYGLYRSIALRTFLGRRGDNFDRFLIRVKEVAEGFRTLAQLLQRLGGRGQQLSALGHSEVAFSEGRTFLNRGCYWVSACRIILALVWLEGVAERLAEERSGF
jgi:NADH-quinone oxidoreductase subunit D